MYQINVRTVAEFAFERGDLSVDRARAERMREGMEGHQHLQRLLDETWKTEEPVAREYETEGVRIRLQGRADAVRRTGGRLSAVEEIKTTHRDPDTVGADEFPEHWAQAEMYASMLCEKEQMPFCQVALVYYNPNGTQIRYSRDLSREELNERLLRYLGIYARWLAALEEWHSVFMSSVGELKFPFPDYRDGQRQMAANVFIAAREKRRVLIEAPTGIGKTAAALFGALKAAGQGLTGPIFYLTARTTGRRSAEQALERMREYGLHVRSVTITAKEKCCIPGGKDCSLCPYGKGYFDRQRGVLREALKQERFGEQEIRAFGEEHSLCPFELSLGLSESADVIICDYNYVFDPRVRLQRFFAGKKSRAFLLVDEAHNLPDRAREMLSARLDGPAIARLRRELGKEDPLYAPMTGLLRTLKAGEEKEVEVTTRPPDPVAAAAEKLADALTDGFSPYHPKSRQLTELLLSALWYVRRHGEFSEKTCRAVTEPAGKLNRISLMCVDAEPHLSKVMGQTGGAALFSATLTPAEFYASLMGVKQEEGDAVLSLGSPFPRGNQLTLLLRTETRFSRREETLRTVCEGIRAMMRGRKGNRIACFPSYSYMEQAYVCFTGMYPEVECIRQRPVMSEAERADFIARFSEGPDHDLLAFLVLGGVFAEGVDLPGDRLIGAAIVTVGIPQICTEREILREWKEDGEGSGYDFAYLWPGFRRVQQAAGRVIRTDTDRGIVLLIDDRFVHEKYRGLMPPHWDVRVLGDPEAVARASERFWSAGDMS